MRVLFSLFLVFWATPASADTWSEAQRGCALFRRSSPAKQARLARGAGYSLEDVRWACGVVRGGGGGGGASYRGPYAPPPRRDEAKGCSGSFTCRFDQHCVNRQCVDKRRRNCSAGGFYSCVSPEKCVNGSCRR